MGQGGAARRAQVARCGKGGETLVDSAGDMPLAQVKDVANFLRGCHGGNELTHIGDVGKEFLNRSDAIGRVVMADESGGEHLEEIFDVAEEEIVLVAVVGVEGGAADFCAVKDVLDGDGLERFFMHEGDKSIAKDIAGGTNAAVDFLCDW